MEWLTNLTNGENGSAINLVLITLALAILLIIVVWIFRKITGSAARRAMRSRVPRLSITDSTNVDDKRFLVMVRRDNVEHLLLIGGANDLVVETNIVRAQSAQKPGATPRGNDAVASQAKSVAEPIAEAEKETPPAPSAAPIAAATAVGAAGLAAVSNATDATAEMASTASETVADAVNNITEEVVSNVSETTSSVTETASETVETVIETVSVEPTPEPEVEIASSPEATETAEPAAEPVVEAAEEVEVPEMDLESTISAKLDDALSNEAIEIEAPEATVDPQNGSDDEMQRLLDELSGETKEPAQ